MKKKPVKNSESNLRDIISTFIIWLVLMCVFAGFGLLVLDWPQYYRLARTGVETEGWVLAKYPDNHMSVRYAYVVDNRNYKGLGQSGGRNPRFEQLEVGDKVSVTYDPKTPALSLLDDPRSQLKSGTSGVVFITLVAPLIILYNSYSRGWLPIAKRRRK